MLTRAALLFLSRHAGSAAGRSSRVSLRLPWRALWRAGRSITPCRPRVNSPGRAFGPRSIISVRMSPSLRRPNNRWRRVLPLCSGFGPKGFRPLSPSS